MSTQILSEEAYRLSNHRRRLIVKFKADSLLPYEDGLEKKLFAEKVGNWSALLKQFPVVGLSRLFDDGTARLLMNLADAARYQKSGYSPPDFFSYFSLDAPQSTDFEALLKATKSSGNVETAYEPGLVIPAGPNPGDQNPHSSRQGYLDPAPVGIDARFAHPARGGKGEEVAVAHLDEGWTSPHEDLPSLGGLIITGTGDDYSEIEHGTSVFGILAALDNRVGTLGIAPAARYGLAGTQYVDPDTGTLGSYSALVKAIDWCRIRNPGIIVIPHDLWYYHRRAYNEHLFPMDSDPMMSALTKMATNLNILVVESAGSANNPDGDGYNLDRYQDADGRETFNPASSHFNDSGAVLVTAASSAAPHTRLKKSNFGGRVDCFAWGEGIHTTSSGALAGRSAYVENFGGTSGATAIVAGAAALLHSMAIASHKRLSARELRDLLRDPDLNTLSADATTDNPNPHKIGMMPDLRKIAEQRDLFRERVNFEADLNKQIRDLLAFAWQFIGPYGAGGFDRILAGGIIVRVPEGGVPEGPLTKLTFDIINALALIQHATEFGKEDASAMRKVGIETLRSATEAMAKIH